jgi:hypothetical protein
MSTVTSTFDGFIGWTDEDGGHHEALLAAGQQFPSNDPMVQARPELFTAPPADPDAPPADAFEPTPAAAPPAPAAKKAAPAKKATG